MTNTQACVGKFALNRSEQPNYNPNWWLGLPKSHPLHDTTPTRKQLARSAKRAEHMSVANAGGLNRKERRTMRSVNRKLIRKAKKGNRK